MAKLLLTASPERQQQLIDAIWDRACGQRMWCGEDQKPPGSRAAGVRERHVRMVDLATGEELEGWVYERLGEPDSQKLLVEHGIGRPPVRETAKHDPVIRLIHRVPGKRDWNTPIPQQQQEEPAGDAAEPAETMDPTPTLLFAKRPEEE